MQGSPVRHHCERRALMGSSPASHTAAGRNSGASDGGTRSSTLKGSAAETALLTSKPSSKENRAFKIRGISGMKARYIE